MQVDMTRARELAETLAPECHGYTYIEVGTAFGLLMFSLGSYSAQQETEIQQVLKDFPTNGRIN